jgi:integrase
MAHIQIIQRKTGKSYKAIIKKGDRVVKTKTFRKKALAQQWVKAMEADHDNIRALGLKGAQMIFSELAQEYLHQWEGRDKCRINQVSWWISRLGNRKLIEISSDEIWYHLDKYAHGNALRGHRGARVSTKPLNRYRKPASVNRLRAALSAVFRYGMSLSKKYITRNPVEGIPVKPENNKRVRFLSDAERDELLASCKNSCWDKLFLLVLMAVCTGARKSELLNLKWNDIDIRRRIASLRTSKNGEPRELPLPVVVIEELMRHRVVGNDLVFGSPIRRGKPFEFRKHWIEALKKSNMYHPVDHPNYFRFHDLRHTAASYLVQNGATLYEAGQILGHKSLITTQRYAHLSISRKQDVTDRVFGEIFRDKG